RLGNAQRGSPVEHGDDDSGYYYHSPGHHDDSRNSGGNRDYGSRIRARRSFVNRSGHRDFPDLYLVLLLPYGSESDDEILHIDGERSDSAGRGTLYESFC